MQRITKRFIGLLLAGLVLGLPGLEIWAAPPTDSALAAANPAGNTPGAESQANTLTAIRQDLTFRQAWEAARIGNRTFGAAKKAETEAYAAWWKSVLAFGPTANFSFQYVLENKPMVTILDMSNLTGRPSIMEMEVSTNYYAGSLNVNQPLFAGFKIVNGNRLASLAYDNARTSLAAAESQLYVDVASAYYSLLVAEQMAAVMAESVKQTEEHLAVVKIKYRAGSVSNYDLLRSEVQLANLKPQLAKTRNALIMARKNLAMTLGYDAEQELQATDELSVTISALAPLPELQQQALAKRWDLVKMERNVEMAEIGQTMALQSNLPNLALTGAWTYYDTVDKDFPPEDANLRHSWTVGLGLSWPLWDNLAFIPKTVEAAAKAEQARLGRQALIEGARLEVEALYLNLQAAQDTLAASEKTVEQAEKGYGIAVQQYGAGMMTNLDVMDAQVALNQAKMNLLQTQYECLMTQVKLRKAIGEVLQ